MPSNYRIRLAEKHDIAQALAISNAAAERSTANLALRPEALDVWERNWEQGSAFYPWFIAYSPEGRALGFTKSYLHGSREAYDWTCGVSVYVEPEFHGLGLAAALYGALFLQLEKQGYVTMIAGITSGNAASERFHAKMGFEQRAQYDRVGWKFGAWHGVGYWQRHIQTTDAEPRPRKKVLEVIDPQYLPSPP